MRIEEEEEDVQVNVSSLAWVNATPIIHSSNLITRRR